MEEEQNSDTCAGCLNLLDEEQYVSALGNNWHLECFRCSACDASLSSWYFEKDGLLFCRDDYWTKYGESCQQCGQVITGPVMVAGEHKFHPECFCCCSCNNFIGDGESYALVERSKLYCGQCYKRQMQPLGRGVVTHSIRLVEIPPSGNSDSGGGPRGIRLSVDNQRGAPVTPDLACRGLRISELICNIYGKISKVALSLISSAIQVCCSLNQYRLDVSSELMSLHIGDKILEVNGTPVRDAPLENIENLIRYSDTVLQLTIEHDPDSLQRRPSYTCPVITKNTQSITVTPTETKFDSKNLEKDVSSNKERLFRRRDEGYMSCSRSRQLRRRQAGDNSTSKNISGGLTEKERSSSMSRLLDGVTPASEGPDLSRTKSFRVEPKTQRVFRGSDLVQGELLGRGFFGQVFKVTHRVTQEVMVLKELYRVDEEAQRNFLKEVAVLRSLNHVNVLRFMGVLYRDKRLHLVTEFVPGGTLRELLHDSAVTLSWEQRVTLAKDIASGMSYLHAQNIIHRDLNSHNCLVREDKTVIVADFGLARIISQSQTGSMGRVSLSPGSTGSVSRRGRRQRYTVVGNPYWMAPEMMKGNKYDEKVDVFSFGIVLCEIIGRVQADPDYLPRSADFGLNQAVFKEKFCATCPEPFYRIAFLCCDLNPDKRPPFEVLEVWLEGMSMHLSVGSELPASLLFDIEHYKGQCTPQSGAQSPESGTQSPRSASKNDSSLPHSSSSERLLKAKRDALRNRDSTAERDDEEVCLVNNYQNKSPIVSTSEDFTNSKYNKGKSSSPMVTSGTMVQIHNDENKGPVKLSNLKTPNLTSSNITKHSVKSTPNTFSRKLNTKLNSIDSNSNSNQSLLNKDKLGKISLELINPNTSNLGNNLSSNLDKNPYSNNIKPKLTRYRSEEPAPKERTWIERQKSEEPNCSKPFFKIGHMQSDISSKPVQNSIPKLPKMRSGIITTGKYVNLANITQDCGSLSQDKESRLNISKFDKSNNTKLGKNCVVNSKPLVLESTAL